MTKIKKLVPNDFYNLLSNALINKWTVISSSDGYHSFSINSNVLTSDGYGIGGFSNPKAWYVIGENDGYQSYQFCVQTNGQKGYRVKFSKLGFINGTPSLLQVPSASDEQVVLGGGTDIKQIYQQILNMHYNFNGFNLSMSIRAKNKNFNIVVKSKVQPPIINPPIQVVNKILT